MNRLALVLLLVIGTAAQAERLRVVTYNIHFGGGVEALTVPKIRIPIPFMEDPELGPWPLPLARGPGQMDRVADALRKLAPDVVLVQEIHSRSVQSLGVDQVERLAERNGWQKAFGAASRVAGGVLSSGGTAIFSRFPITDVRAVTLTERGDGLQGRNVVRARVAVPGLEGGLVAAVTHLSVSPAGGQRRKEVEGVARAMSDVTGAAVVGGDFNEKPGGADVAAMLGMFAAAGTPLTDAFAAGGAGEGGSFPAATSPRSRIDYVFGSAELRVVSARVAVEVQESDHLPVVVDYEYGAGGEVAARPVSLLGVMGN